VCLDLDSDGIPETIRGCAEHGADDVAQSPLRPEEGDDPSSCGDEMAPLDEVPSVFYEADLVPLLRTLPLDPESARRLETRRRLAYPPFGFETRNGCVHTLRVHEQVERGRQVALSLDESGARLGSLEQTPQPLREEHASKSSSDRVKLLVYVKESDTLKDEILKTVLADSAQFLVGQTEEVEEARLVAVDEVVLLVRHGAQFVSRSPLG
jgi:hypothetical protein